MNMQKKIPLLAESLKECITNVYNKHNSKIANDLLTANKLIESYNNICNYSDTIPQEQQIVLEELFNDKIKSIINDEARALSIRKDTFEIAFTPKGKELIYTSQNTWSREYRQTGKLGRIIKKLLIHEYKERDIELFNNQLKSEILYIGEFKIVSGEEIPFWYLEDNYYQISGSLGKSCMRHAACQNYFDIYKDMAKMIICVKDDLLLGRALLWDIDGKTFMDRVYVCMDYLEEQFYQKAMENKWIVRETNALLSDGETQYWLTPDNNYKIGTKIDCVLVCKSHYNLFPYMDSFRYYDKDSNKLYCTYDCECTPLSNTTGEIPELEMATCDVCGETERFDDGYLSSFYYSNFYDCYLCPDCAIYSEFLEDYIPCNIDITKISYNGHYSYVPTDYVVDNYTMYNVYDPNAVFIRNESGEYVYESNVIWSDEFKCYK